jgi:hypothetical protein
MFFTGMPFDHARNTAVQRAIEGGYTWLLFLDDDVVPPANVFDLLSRHGLDIVSGLYYRRSKPVMPVMMREVPQGTEYITSFTPGTLLEADLVGSGCLLIHRRVLLGMKKPWFEWLLDHDELPENQRCSEDYDFCRKARKAGFRIFVDTSVQCKHIGYGQSLIGGAFEPVEI